jgi:hypothetical protein
MRKFSSRSVVAGLLGAAGAFWVIAAQGAANPGPVTNDPRYPYVDNGAARRAGGQPTYRVADLNNPILQPWAKESMKKANDEVLDGKVPFRPRERCYPGGVPGFVVYTLVMPFYFLQTEKEVTIINRGGPETRRVYLNVPHSANPKPSWYGESVGITRMAIRWWSIRSLSPPRPSSTITARRIPTNCM